MARRGMRGKVKVIINDHKSPSFLLLAFSPRRAREVEVPARRGLTVVKRSARRHPGRPYRPTGGAGRAGRGEGPSEDGDAMEPASSARAPVTPPKGERAEAPWKRRSPHGFSRGHEEHVPL